MAELIAASAEVWESDPAAQHYNPVGYVALGAAAQEGDLTEVAERHERIGYPLQLIVGEAAVRGLHARALPRLAGAGLRSACTSTAAGSPYSRDSCRGSPRRPEAGVQSLDGVAVTGFDSDGSGAVTSVDTDEGAVEVEQVVVAVGRGSRRSGGCSTCRDDVGRAPAGAATCSATRTCGRTGTCRRARSRSTGDVLPPRRHAPPMIHVDSDAPLHDDDGPLITDQLWGTYFKRDRTGVQGGSSPLRLGHDFDVDPYPTATVEPALRRTCGARRSRTASSASRAAGRGTATSARAASAPSPRTASRCSTGCARTCT